MRLPPLTLAAHDIHDVSSASSSSLEANTCVGVDVLADVLGALRTIGYTFVDFGQFMSERRNGDVALLTFDDGYRSVRDHALPMLAAQAVPAVIFLVSSTLRSRGDPFPHWLHVVRDNSDALEQAACAPFVSHEHVGRVLKASGFESLRDLLAQPLGVPNDAFRTTLTQAELAELAEIVAGLPGLGRVTMSEADVKELTGPVEFGAHSVTHRSFAFLTKPEIEFEVTDSAATISALTGKSADSIPFAYPYGAVTVHAEHVVRQVCRAGFTCQGRPATALDSSASLPRVNLDAEALRIATEGSRATHILSLGREKIKRYVRTGPLWAVLGPIRNAVLASGGR